MTLLSTLFSATLKTPAKLNFKKNGVEHITSIISKEIIDTLCDDISKLDDNIPKHGIRNAQNKIPSIKTLAQSKSIITMCEKTLGKNPTLIRAIYFDKTINNNWLVPWHQDKTICVNRKAQINNWGHGQ